MQLEQLINKRVSVVTANRAIVTGVLRRPQVSQQCSIFAADASVVFYPQEVVNITTGDDGHITLHIFDRTLAPGEVIHGVS